MRFGWCCATRFASCRSLHKHCCTFLSYLVRCAYFCFLGLHILLRHCFRCVSVLAGSQATATIEGRPSFSQIFFNCANLSTLLVQPSQCPLGRPQALPYASSTLIASICLKKLYGHFSCHLSIWLLDIEIMIAYVLRSMKPLHMGADKGNPTASLNWCNVIYGFSSYKYLLCNLQNELCLKSSDYSNITRYSCSSNASQMYIVLRDRINARHGLHTITPCAVRYPKSFAISYFHRSLFTIFERYLLLTRC